MVMESIEAYMDPLTSMLSFACTDEEASVGYSAGTVAETGVTTDGIRPAEGAVVWFDRFENARRACEGRRLYVVDVYELERSDLEAGASVPPEAVLNARPYRPPAGVAAAGGFVTRMSRKGREVLLIHRRGVWDLPKGKVDAGESIRSCAVREVREEVGIEDLRILAPLGGTVHGYVQGSRYMVKTTYWFAMQTDASSFSPQGEEGIDSVAWVLWDDAERRIGFETLRRHMRRIRHRIEEAART